ncbi:substrate-binding domain-containing protein [Bosea sp. BIWAKO-01]|uniref:substrate-binding domain-containing protein n=1 Tax=Bosea sp. BIWAKO-01 TaxID=506668 RepID=UPI00086BB2C8|nr:transcriptional regulator of LysR family [Bosea sp. BIWAKO-01]
MELTPAGKVLQPYAEELMQLADEARAAMGAIAARPAGSVTIGALETIASAKLPQWLAGFSREHPEITLTIKIASSGELMRRLADGDIDVAFRFDPPDLDERLARRPIAAAPLVIIASPDKRSALAGDLAAFAGARFIVTEVGCVYRRLFDEAFAQAGLACPSPAAEVGSIAMIVRLVASGAGIGLVPHFAVAEALERGEIAGAPWPGPPPSLSMIWRRRRIQPAALKHFLAASDSFEPIRSAGVRPRHAIPSPS